ncbi:hypothetical protein IGI04_016979 [Brassica rapa subsp. trilocularis]|uniref:Uncharacterized protein n=1 Tax=Brassica rapa subsp. trilocularis TaxID=1813537 RepID=A0ABQ7MUJ6_BRACM|nr:hypothetical protein IGI04_016979 [Brassica rapa subsp. trilocularis]
MRRRLLMRRRLALRLRVPDLYPPDDEAHGGVREVDRLRRGRDREEAFGCAWAREGVRFDWMELISLQGKTNFFEKRVGDYQKASVMSSFNGGGAFDNH